MRPSTPPVVSTSLTKPKVRLGYSAQHTTSAVAAELSDQVWQAGAAIAMAFVSNRYDRGDLAQHLEEEFGPVPIIGCTTSGEIGPSGYMDGGVSAFSLGADDLTFEFSLLQDVSRRTTRECQAFAYGLRQKLIRRVPDLDTSRCFALLLIDGLCGHEEIVARAISDALGGIAMVGGSAGDGLEFRETAVLYGGRFHKDAAVLLVASTPHRFTSFKTQHFESGTHRLVLTGVIPERRTATEINGLPAAEEYARAVGVSWRELGPAVFSAHPLVVKIGGSDFVRSIQKANPDGSLTFFSAIEQGLIFNLGHGRDLAENLEALFKNIEQTVGPPQLVIGCDCILRRLELIENGGLQKVSRILREHNVIGFSSYGEQFRGMHVNQTFTGIAIGV